MASQPVKCIMHEYVRQHTAVSVQKVRRQATSQFRIDDKTRQVRCKVVTGVLRKCVFLWLPSYPKFGQCTYIYLHAITQPSAVQIGIGVCAVEPSPVHTRNNNIMLLFVCRKSTRHVTNCFSYSMLYRYVLLAVIRCSRHTYILPPFYAAPSAPHRPWNNKTQPRIDFSPEK